MAPPTTLVDVLLVVVVALVASATAGSSQVEHRQSTIVKHSSGPGAGGVGVVAESPWITVHSSKHEASQVEVGADGDAVSIAIVTPRMGAIMPQGIVPINTTIQGCELGITCAIQLDVGTNSRPALPARQQPHVHRTPNPADTVCIGPCAELGHS